MIQTLRIIETNCLNPYENLAMEQFLLENQPKDSMTLYLWQNKNTVVIGRNQNPWKECRTGLLEEEGGLLSRRLSGGGAVFHDIGNLNFTFLTSNEDYDVDKQLSVIQTACAFSGITAEKSGRNDLLADGRKFSGNAFYHNKDFAYHHGTLMIDVDTDKLGRYLSPPKAKLEAKGVASVRSRVVNLNQLAPSLTCETMKVFMRNAFQEVYGMQAEEISLSHRDREEIAKISQTISSWDYLYGKPLPFTFACESHFSWGHIQLQLEAKNGVIQAVKIYSDAMDWSLPEKAEAALTGCRFVIGDMAAALSAAVPQYGEDLILMLRQQGV